MFEADKWRIVYYVSSSIKNNPVKEFLDANLKAKLKALRIFSNIEEYGLTSVIPHIKKLTGTPLWEIRILGEDSVRILYVTEKEKNLFLHLSEWLMPECGKISRMSLILRSRLSKCNNPHVGFTPARLYFLIINK